MPAHKLTALSLSKLATCHRDLQRLVKALVEDGVALHVLCGHRNKYEQDKAFADGKSRLKFPKSKHNSYPAKAVDLTPVPLDWSAQGAFLELAAKVQAKAKALGIKLRYGGDWDQDGKVLERGENDLVHFELVAE
jgi:peptidoglycan L-alanyl-D-glutamate endopeptidase CwlK